MTPSTPRFGPIATAFAYLAFCALAGAAAAFGLGWTTKSLFIESFGPDFFAASVVLMPPLALALLFHRLFALQRRARNRSGKHLALIACAFAAPLAFALIHPRVAIHRVEARFRAMQASTEAVAARLDAILGSKRRLPTDSEVENVLHSTGELEYELTFSRRGDNAYELAFDDPFGSFTPVRWVFDSTSRSWTRDDPF